MDTTELLADVRRVWLGPKTTVLGTDDDTLVAHLNRALYDKIVPRVIDLGEEYLIAEDRLTLTAGVQKYRIPARAYDSQIREAVWRSSAQDSRAKPLDWIPRSQRDYYPREGQPRAAYLEGDNIVLMGDPSGLLDLAYPFAPGELVTADNFRKIASVDLGAKTVVLEQAAPSDWLNTDLYDILSGHGSHQPLYWDLAPTTVSGANLIFSTEISGETFGRYTPAKGDYVVKAGKAATPMVPRGLHGILVEAACERIAEAHGDSEAHQRHQAAFLSQFKEQLLTLDQRVQQRRVIVNTNSRFRRTLRARRRFL